jgi:hypothetical protein
MAWQDKIPLIIRGVINDMDSPYRYSDTRLEELACISAVFVANDVIFSVSYTIDIENQIITPDPSSDSAFVALVSMRTACMILNGEYTTASNKGIVVKDGPASIDTSKMVDAKKELANKACKDYDIAKKNYIFGDGSICKAIVTPFNVYNIYQNILS